MHVQTGAHECCIEDNLYIRQQGLRTFQLLRLHYVEAPKSTSKNAKIEFLRIFYLY